MQQKLYDDLFKSGEYNKLVRPVANSSHTLTIYIDLQLWQIIDVDEKNQVVGTNVWLEHVFNYDLFNLHMIGKYRKII